MWSGRYQWSLGLINKGHNQGATVMRGDHWHPWLGSGVSSSGWRSPLASHIPISLPSEFHALCQGFANPLFLELTGQHPSCGISASHLEKNSKKTAKKETILIEALLTVALCELRNSSFTKHILGAVGVSRPSNGLKFVNIQRSKIRNQMWVLIKRAEDVGVGEVKSKRFWYKTKTLKKKFVDEKKKHRWRIN